MRFTAERCFRSSRVVGHLSQLGEAIWPAAYNTGMPASPPRNTITESPWYWVYLFATAGLIALLLAGPKYAVRQTRLENNREARIRAAQLAAGQDVEQVEATEQQSPSIPLWPLYVVLGGALAAAWFNLWWRRRGVNAEAQAADLSNEASP